MVPKLTWIWILFATTLPFSSTAQIPRDTLTRVFSETRAAIAAREELRAAHQAFRRYLACLLALARLQEEAAARVEDPIERARQVELARRAREVAAERQARYSERLREGEAARIRALRECAERHHQLLSAGSVPTVEQLVAAIDGDLCAPELQSVQPFHLPEISETCQRTLARSD